MKVEEGECVAIFDAEKKEEEGRNKRERRSEAHETERGNSGAFGLRLPNNNKPLISPFSFVLARPIKQSVDLHYAAYLTGRSLSDQQK